MSREATDIEALRVLAEKLYQAVSAERASLQQRIIELSPDHLDKFYEDALKA